MRITFVRWLVILLVLAAAAAGLRVFLALQEQLVAARVVTGVGAVVVNAWLIYALVRWRQVRWVARFNALLILTAVAALLVGLSWALRLDGAVFFFASAWAMAAMFALGLALLRLVLSPGYATIGVARTLLDEAIRMKTPLIFIVMLLLLVPVLPIIVSGQDVLRYRVQTFLTWSMLVTSVLLSLMTIFLAVGSVTGEIEKRQIFLTLTKPVGRVQYLLGKWLGIAALNLLLVAVTGAAIYAMTMWLARSPGQTGYDKAMVSEQVLVARQTVAPQPATERGMTGLVLDRLEVLRREDPGTYGQPGAPVETLSDDLKEAIAREEHQKWFTLGPLERKTFRFTGLDNLQGARTLQLRLEPKPVGSSPDGFVHLEVRLNGRPYVNPYAGPLQSTPVFRLVGREYNVIDLPTAAVPDDGVLEVELFNRPNPAGLDEPSIAFNIADGLQMLYKVGGFEANLLRSLGILWMRLLFLGMLGIFASTFLGFPVASLLCALVYIVAAGHGYITESFQFYAAFPKEQMSLWDTVVGVFQRMGGKIEEGEYWEAAKVVIRVIGSGFTLLVPSFAEFDPTPKLADGRLVSWELLGNAVWRIGLLWSGVLALLAAYVFHKREIAQVQV